MSQKPLHGSWNQLHAHQVYGTDRRRSGTLRDLALEMVRSHCEKPITPLVLGSEYPFAFRNRSALDNTSIGVWSMFLVFCLLTAGFLKLEEGAIMRFRIILYIVNAPLNFGNAIHTQRASLSTFSIQSEFTCDLAVNSSEVHSAWTIQYVTHCTESPPQIMSIFKNGLTYTVHVHMF